MRHENGYGKRSYSNMPTMILSIRFLKLFLIGCLVSGSAMAQQPQNYLRNNHVAIESFQKDDLYLVDYTFRDQFNQSQQVSINLPVAQTRRMVSRFGIPSDMLGPYMATEEVIRLRNQIMREGLFSPGKVITVDLSAATSYYRPFARQIADQLTQKLIESGQDSRSNRIEMAMKFVQDIPYGIPQFDEADRYYGGLLTPPEVLLYRYGDCDSKTVLFAGILSYMIDPDDIVFLRCPDHVLTGISGEPEKGQFYVVASGDSKKYILAETAGPGRVAWGNPGSNYQAGKEYRIEKLVLNERSDAEWTIGERGYYFTIGGKSVTDRLNNAWAGDNLLVFDNQTQTTYLLDGFRNERPKVTHSAKFLVGPAFWMKEEGKFYFFVNGQSAGHRTITEWSGKDLLVKDTGTGKKYLLKGYKDIPNGVVTPAYIYRGGNS